MKRRFFIITVLFLAISIIGCTPSVAPKTTETPTTTQPSGAIAYSEAKDHIGEQATVYGPVVGGRYSPDKDDKPTELWIGKTYPDPNHVLVVIWGTDRDKFPSPPESYYFGKTIYITGLITEMTKGQKRFAEIEVKDPSQIKEQ